MVYFHCSSGVQLLILLMFWDRTYKLLVCAEKHPSVSARIHVFFFFVLVAYNGFVSKYKQSPLEYCCLIVAQPDTQLQFAAAQTIQCQRTLAGLLFTARFFYPNIKAERNRD